MLCGGVFTGSAFIHVSCGRLRSRRPLNAQCGCVANELRALEPASFVESLSGAEQFQILMASCELFTPSQAKSVVQLRSVQGISGPKISNIFRRPIESALPKFC